ncbi:MAG: 50S ribosomal protein L17 [Clostridia bacterium]|nr:50S ribosomal protein L17 [Clostridia bacterium]
MPGTRKLGRPTAHRNAMLRGMVTYLFENGRIETTYTRAKEVSALADKMITIAKENTLASYRQLMAYLTKEDVVKKLTTTIVSDYEGVSGGYTQVLKAGPRRGDAAEMAIVRLTPVAKPEAKEEPKKPAKKAAKAAE